MNKKLIAGLALSVLVSASAFGAWGDVSYDPNPALSDLDRNASFDTFGLLTSIVASTTGNLSEVQNFESGFAAGQVLNDWVSMGGNRIRFGFGDTLTAVDWRSRIGQIDPNGAAFGVTHPHGTYGNASGVLGDPRNYIADHYFLTSDTVTGAPVPRYFVMQFESSINFLALTLLDYANRVGGLAHLDLFLGADLATADAVPIVGSNSDHVFGADTEDGAIDYFVAHGAWPVNQFPAAFNFAVLRLDTGDATVGFDNLLTARTIPEPGSFALLLGGIGLLAASRSMRR